MAAPTEKKPADKQARVGLVLKDFEQDKKPHDKYSRDVDSWYRAYRGLIENRSKAADWTSKLHPPYVFQVVESMVANVVDPNPRWSVRPRPRTGNPQEIQDIIAGAKANELLLAEQVDADHFAQKQMAFAKQAFIANLSVFKTRWNYQTGEVRRQGIVNVEGPGGVLIPRLAQLANKGVLRDDPTADVVDVRDWFPHEAATSLDAAMRVTHRVWMSYDELRLLEQQGVYGPKAGGDSVAKLKESRDFRSETANRETDLFEADRTKDQIEVLEQWRREPDGTISVVAVGNRSVLLRDQPSPFWHNEFPFVVCAPVPDLNRIYGISVVGQICDLQEAAWSLLNQRLDNTELLNNAVVVIADDYEGEFEWAPGAQNYVSRPDQVKILEVNPVSAQISIPAEEKIKDDLQNIPGASPSLLGQVDNGQQTATEVSVTTSLAQRRVALMKHQFTWAYKRVGEQWMSLNQQFIRQPRDVERLGEDGAHAFQTITPLLLQGDYYISIDAMDDSLIKQQRQASAQAKLQVALSAAPVAAALAQAGQARMINLDAYIEDFLDAHEVADKDRYFTSKTPPPLPPQQGQQPTQPTGDGAGQTAPQATDPNSPSNAFSQSPVGAMQQMLAGAGGANNTPNG